MAKKPVQGSILKLQVKAGQANPAPPIGPALGQRGINIMEFCKLFNEKSKQYAVGTLLKVAVIVRPGKGGKGSNSFEIELRGPVTSRLLLEKANIDSGSGTPNKVKVAKLTRRQIEEIAMIKKSDLTANSLEAQVRTIVGTALSLGITVEGF